MENEIKEILEKYPADVCDLYYEIRGILYGSITGSIEEALWAKLPSYFFDGKFVRFIPFKNHINIEAEGVDAYKKELSGYKITPKGMLQIYLTQEIPTKALSEIFQKMQNR